MELLGSGFNVIYFSYIMRTVIMSSNLHKCKVKVTVSYPKAVSWHWPWEMTENLDQNDQSLLYGHPKVKNNKTRHSCIKKILEFARIIYRNSPL